MRCVDRVLLLSIFVPTSSRVAGAFTSLGGEEVFDASICLLCNLTMHDGHQ